MKHNNRLIVVDDEPDILEAYRMMLNAPATAAGIVSSRSNTSKFEAPERTAVLFDVTYVNSGEAAVKEIQEKLNAGTPYLGGFFDVKLGPGIDGLEAICRIKQMDPHFMCVIVTAYQDRTVEEIRKLFGDDFSGNWDIMTKPFFRLEILQKAFNLCSNWNNRERVKRRIRELQSRSEKQSQLVRELIEIIGNKIVGKAEFGLTKSDTEEIKMALRSILTDANQLRAAVSKLQILSKEEEKKKAA